MHKERNIQFDNIKGLLILSVVFGHFLYAFSNLYKSSLVNDLFVLIYSFHMPAFVFISGYFSKSENARNNNSILKLITYYIIFNTIIMIFLYFYKDTAFSLLTPYYSYWYILSLIIWRLSIKYLDKIKGIIPITFILALLIGFSSEFTNVLSIRRTIAFLPFFIMGYKFSLNKFNLIYKKINKNKIFPILLFLFYILYVIAVFCLIRKFQLTNSMLLMSKYKQNSDLIIRLLLFLNSIIIIIGMLLFTPKKKIIGITKFGENSLTIFLIHRIIVIVLSTYLVKIQYTKLIVILLFVLSIILCLILSVDKIKDSINGLVNLIIKNNKTISIFVYILFIVIFAILAFKPIKEVFGNINKEPEKIVQKETIIHNISDKEQELSNSIRISYVGDLILLKNQVEYAKDYNNDYNFEPMFEYTKPYLQNSDLAIGVFEGPTAGDEYPYSTSNYGDGIKLYLNFPDSFAKAVKNSGIDLVTTANNHLLDRGIDGALRTLDVLDKYNIDHVGSYRTQEEKEEIKIMEIDGVKIAIIAFTKSVNYYKPTQVYEEYPYLTSIIPMSSNPYYDEMYSEIENLFNKAKESGADVIVAMPHMGTQFKHTTNAFQNKWNEIFVELGADIVLGDHAHAVQPIEYIGDSVIVNCPGNFANSYTSKDGDATSIVNIYINKDTKKVVLSSVVPMYTQEYEANLYRALPIYEIYNNKKLYSSMSNYELHRVSKVQSIITKSMIGIDIDTNNLQKEYYYYNNHYYSYSLMNKDLYKNSKIYNLLEESKKIVFIGDSITEGTKNQFHPWYEPMMSMFDNKTVINISKGSYTTKNVISNFSNEIRQSQGDLYFIAIGTNDIRYRNTETCAMTSEDYIKQIETIVNLIKEQSPSAKIVLIAPWQSDDSDTISKINTNKKNILMKEYSNSLNTYAENNEYYYIDPNEYIWSIVKNDINKYLVDFIHPNSSYGIILYSEAILKN